MLSDSVHVCESYSKPNVGAFFETRCIKAFLIFRYFPGTQFKTQIPDGNLMIFNCCGVWTISLRPHNIKTE